MRTAEYNRKAQSKWYNKQRNAGLIYLLTFADGEVYVGKTTSCLQKRLWRHKATPTKYLVGKDFTGATIELLHKREPGEDIDILEQYYIKKHS